MKTRKQRAAEEAAAKALKEAELRAELHRPKDAHYIPHDRERLDGACDSCGERFYVDAAEVRCNGEIEIKCPHCNRKMLAQHVEYVSVMVID